MVLKHKIHILFLFIAINGFAKIELKHTDKYETNFYSDSNIETTEFYIGSNLLEFIDESGFVKCYNFLDSTLKNEKIIFDTNIELKNNNTLKIVLSNSSQKDCDYLSIIWFSKYNIKWIELLNSLTTDKLKKPNSTKLILKDISNKEKNRPFNSTNIINTTQLAFVVFDYISNNNKINNSKRFSLENDDLEFIQIIENEKLNKNEICTIFPTCNKNTFLSNCVSLYILQQENNFDIHYRIAQALVKTKLKTDKFDVKTLKPNFSFKEGYFSQQKAEAVTSIINSIDYDNLFFYSFSDLLELKKIKFTKEYDKDNVLKYIETINSKSNFIIEISNENNYIFNTYKLETLICQDFKLDLKFKQNSIEFINEEDYNVINKLYLFLVLNKNHLLSITSFSNKKEYIYIEKNKKQKILNKYKESGYSISKLQRLKLYRSLFLFDELTKKGVNPKRINCFGIGGNKSIAKFELTK